MTKEEEETVVRWDSASDVAHVFTCHRSIARRLLAAGFDPVRHSERGKVSGTWSFEIPKKWVKIRRPRTGKKLTEGEKVEARARLDRARRSRGLSKTQARKVETSQEVG